MMTGEVEQRHWFRDVAQRGVLRLPVAGNRRLEQLREKANRALDDMPAIGRRQEDWRYTRIDSLLDQDFYPDETDSDTSFTSDTCPVTPLTDAWRLVFVNGRYAPQLSNDANRPDGVTLVSLAESLARDPQQAMRWLGSLAGQGRHLFHALNSAILADGLFLHVEKGVHLEQPVELLCLGAARAQPTLAPLRNLVVLEAGAQLTLVERFASEASARTFHNGLTEIRLEAGATLNHVSFQDVARSAWHLDSLFVSQDTGSQYHGVSLMLGGAWSRMEYKVDFTGEDAVCDLAGLYAVGRGQLSDIHLDIDHSLPSCRSRSDFRGLLYGKGRAVFDGCIRVGEAARQTDAQLRNDNLVLAPDAEIDTKPRLEIYADEVKCSHGTTVGQLDPQQVFYLRSRGIDEAAARILLATGFAAEITRRLDDPVLCELADSLLHDRLAATADGTGGA